MWLDCVLVAFRELNGEVIVIVVVFVVVIVLIFVGIVVTMGAKHIRVVKADTILACYREVACSTTTSIWPCICWTAAWGVCTGAGAGAGRIAERVLLAMEGLKPAWATSSRATSTSTSTAALIWWPTATAVTPLAHVARELCLVFWYGSIRKYSAGGTA